MSSDSVIKAKAVSAAGRVVGFGGGGGGGGVSPSSSSPSPSAASAAAAKKSTPPSSTSSDSIVKSPSSPALDGSLDGSEDSLSGSETNSTNSSSSSSSSSTHDVELGAIHDFWEAEMLDLLEKHQMLVSMGGVGDGGVGVKEAESLLRKWQHAHHHQLSSSDSDTSLLLSLQQQLATKMQHLEASSTTKSAASGPPSIRPKIFNDVFEMEAYFRQHRPIIPTIGLDGESSGQLPSGHSNPNVVSANASVATASSPSANRAKVPPAAGAASSASPVPKRPPGKVTASNTTGATTPATPTSAPKRRKAAADSGAALRDQVARRAKRKQSVLVARSGAVTMRKARFHIVVDVSEVHLYLGQEATLSLCLYSLVEDRMVSEEISFPLPSTTQAVPPGKARVTFTDVSIASIEDLHLICRVVRIGKLKYDYAKAQQLAATATGVLGNSPSSVAAATLSVSSALPSAAAASGISSSDVKRPFAVAALALSDAVEVEDSKPTKSAVHLFAPADEVEFPRAHQYIINEDRDHPLTLIKAKGLVLTLRQVSGAFPGLETTHANLKRYGTGSFSRPLELRDGDTRHDLYITLDEGLFTPDATKGSKEPNIEIIAEPCSADGRLVVGCIPHKSCVYYHIPTPAWQETVRLDLNKVKDIQFVNFVARQLSETGKFSELGSAKLMVQNADGSLVANGSKTVSLAAKGATLSVTTLIVSSKYSSNVPLMSLLNWKTSSSSISEVLVKCTLLDKAEIIKFHKEIFDALLEIMELLPDVAGLAFSTMVAILANASESGQNSEDSDPLQKCIDTFISRTFSNPRAHYVLLDQLTMLATNVIKTKEGFRTSQRAFALALKAMPYVLQLVLKSRLEWHKKRPEGRPSVAAVFQTTSNSADNQLASSQTHLQNDDEFKSELSRAIMSLAAVAAKDEAQLVGLQTKLVRTFPLTLSVLEAVFSASEQRSIMEYFLDNISTETSSLGVDKLLLIESYMGSLLTPQAIVRHLKVHLRRSKEEKLHCIRLVGVLLRDAMSRSDPGLKSTQVFIPTATAAPPRGASFSGASSSPQSSPQAGSVTTVPSSGSGRIKLKPSELDSLRSSDVASDAEESKPEKEKKDRKEKEKKHRDKKGEKTDKPGKGEKTEKPDKGEKKEHRDKDKDKDRTKKSRSDSGTAPSPPLDAEVPKDYEQSLRDKLLAGKQKRSGISTADSDSLPHKIHLHPDSQMSLWALLLDIFPPLTRVLCGDMSATALGAAGDDDYRAASARSTGTALTASAAIDLSSRLELMTVLTGILSLISSQQIAAFFSHLRGKDAEMKLLKSLVEGCLEMVGRLGAEQFNFPATWPELVFKQLRVIIKVIRWLEAPISQLRDEDSDAHSIPRCLTDEQMRLSSRYIRLISATIQHRGLDLETYSLRAKQVCLVLTRNPAVDVRLTLARRLVRAWKRFYPYHLSLVPDVIVYLLSMCVSGEKTGALKSVATGLYSSLLLTDAQLADDWKFSQVEVRTIQALEELSRSSCWNETSLRKFFDVELKQHFKVSFAPVFKEQSLQQKLNSFVGDMQSLLTLLSELRGLPSGAEYEEERAFALTQLMTYLRQTQHGDAYVKYAHKLSRMYEEAEQYVEAGFAMLQHANSLDWSTKLLSPVLHYPAHLSRERKILLMRQSLALFERGRSYEQAINVLQQMVVADRDVLFDYERLSSNLRLQADFYEKIMSEERFFSNYFFVYYFGTGFPKALRKKAFIYRGLELERIPNFIQRMSKKFPAAEIVKTTEPVVDHDRQGQYLQIFAVQPTTDDEMLGREKPAQQGIPERILKYRQANEVRVFVYSRPFRKDAGKKDKDENEFANLWIAKTFCVVAETFPNVQRRLEVVERREIVLSPIENAVNAVAAKNTELQELFVKFSQHDNVIKIDRLSMALQGVLDAAVNGGTAKYQSAFLTPDFKKSNPDKIPFVSQLEEQLRLQVQILGRGLSLHSELVPDALLGLHGHLDSQYHKLAEQMKINAGQFYRAAKRDANMPGLSGGVVGSIMKSASRSHLTGNPE